MGTKTLVSIDEFEQMAETLGPCELIDGEIVSMAPGGFEHSYSTSSIVQLLGHFVKAQKLGRVLTNEAGIVIREDPARACGADVAFVSYKRIPKGSRPRGFLRVPPELIVEVIGVDNTWQSIEEKVQEYHSIGVDMVWVADPNTRTVKKYPRGAETSIVHEGQIIDGGEVLPGFSAPVSEFFDE